MSDVDNKPIVIVGAGITGLSLGYLLAKRGMKTVIIEKEDVPGGLARSFKYDEYTYDIGPHRFHTEDKTVEKFIRDVLAEDVHTIDRKSCVQFKGEFYPWPLHPSYVLAKFPPKIALGVVKDLFRLLQKRTAVTFKDQVVNMYGQTLYREFFQGYSSKFLGITPELTHPNWAKTGIDRAIIDERLEIKTLWQLLMSILNPGERKDLKFIYPTGGCSRFIQRLTDLYEQAGGELLCGKAVDEVTAKNGIIRTVRVGDREFEPAKVVWTGTIHSLMEMLDLGSPNLKYLSLVCYNIMLSEGAHFDFQWSYHSAADALFSRVSIPENFHPGNTPPGKRSMCVEVTCHKDDHVFAEPDKYIERLLVDMEREKLLATVHEVENINAEKIPWAYPIYQLDYLDQVKKIRKATAAYSNLIRAGRLGRFWYNNMDHCIEASQKLADKILAD